MFLKLPVLLSDYTQGFARVLPDRQRNVGAIDPTRTPFLKPLPVRVRVLKAINHKHIVVGHEKCPDDGRGGLLGGAGGCIKLGNNPFGKELSATPHVFKRHETWIRPECDVLAVNLLTKLVNLLGHEIR